MLGKRQIFEKKNGFSLGSTTIAYNPWMRRLEKKRESTNSLVVEACCNYKEEIGLT
jgi:hypothetical protein